MAFDGVKESTEDIQRQTQEYLEQTEAYVKLKVFQILMKIVIGSIQLLVLGALCGIILLLVSFGLAVHLGEVLDSALGGFLVVVAIYALIGLILYLLRNSLNKMIIGRFSALFFEQE